MELIIRLVSSITNVQTAHAAKKRRNRKNNIKQETESIKKTSLDNNVAIYTAEKVNKNLTQNIQIQVGSNKKFLNLSKLGFKNFQIMSMAPLEKKINENFDTNKNVSEKKIFGTKNKELIHVKPSNALGNSNVNKIGQDISESNDQNSEIPAPHTSGKSTEYENTDDKTNEKIEVNENDQFFDEDLKQYICRNCGDSFKNKKELSYHFIRHLNLKKCKCEICDAVFHSKIAFELHLKTHSEREYFCQLCKKTFYLKDDFNFHICVNLNKMMLSKDGSNIMQNEKKQPGGKSKIQIVQLGVPNFDKTQNVNTSEGEQYKQVLLIEETKKIETDLDKFEKFYEDKQDLTSRTCKICNTVLASKKSLNQHKLTHMKPYVCEICLDIFKTKHILTKHKIEHHENIMRERLPNSEKVVCPTCGKLYKSKASLDLHMKHHTDNKRYFCSICNKRFLYKSTLDNHMNIHTGQKGATCEKCGKSFIHYGSLQYHKYTHINIRPYECLTCNLKFKTRLNLKLHKRVHEVRKHVCEICNKGFITKQYLKDHIHTHMKEKYDCKTCHKSFVWGSSYRKHLLKHRKSEDDDDETNSSSAKIGE